MQAQNHYEQLQSEGRMTIASLSQQGCCIAISRELARTKPQETAYGSHRAQQPSTSIY